MGNQFSFYNGNKQLTFSNVIEIFSFVIYNSNLSNSNFTLGPNILANWEFTQNDNGNGTYNLLFRYKPSGVYTVVPANYYGTTVPPLLVFTSTSNLSTGLTVHWTNLVSNVGNVSSNPSFNSPYVTEPVAYSMSSGGGDPHIIPYFNHMQKVYLLPTNDHIYKYFDNLDPDERLVINAKTWVLDSDFIKYVENLKKNNDSLYNSEKTKIVNHIKNPPYKILDTSFIRYITVIYKTKHIREILTLDMESFQPVEFSKDEDVKLYNLLPLLPCDNKYTILKLTESNYNTDTLIYPTGIKFRQHVGKYSRKICINTNKHGPIDIIFYREYERPNHRNHLELIFKNTNKITQNNCSGALISIDYVEEIDSLLTIKDDLDPQPKNRIHCITTEQFKNNYLHN